MLDYLRARNLGLIRDAELTPHPGLTVISGETGAGKTLLLGAIRLLLGEQADASMVGPHGEAAQADGVLVGEEGELGVSRTVPAEGRSRSYLNGAIASAEALAEKVGGAIQVVGQHDQLELKKTRYVLALLDSNLEDDDSEASAYRKAWEAYKALLDEAGRLGGSEAELARELDLARHQSDEIARSGFSAGDESDLEHQERRLRNAGEIRESLHDAITAIDSIDATAGELVGRLRKVGSLDPEARHLVEGAETLAATASELSRDLRDAAEDLVDDPVQLDLIEQRLTHLGDLRRKYGKTIDEILEYGRGAEERARQLEELLVRASSIDTELDRSTEELANAASRLGAARRRAAARLKKSIVAHLAEVGLETARVEFAFEGVDPGPSGADRVEIGFASHRDLATGPLTKVASGGELSRLILAVSLATSSSDHATVVFDEVDAGIGGATALAMGRKLSDLALDRQVLCVTHLPQVAAFADAHYVIRRSENEAALHRVEGPARLEELSRMIAGLPESDRGQQAAVELLELSGKRQ